MKIILITDIHYGENTNYPNVGGADYVNAFGEQFQHFFPHLLSEMEQGDLVVNLGDFIHDENLEKDIETYKNALTFFSVTTLTKHVLGNHDVRNIPREKWIELVGVKKSYHSFDLGGYHHIILDGNRAERRGPFYIGEEQLVWLEQDLAETSLKTIIYCHFPMDNQNMDSNYYFKEHPESASLANKHFVRNILKKSGKVLAVFSGHTHFLSQQVVNDTIHCTIPSFSENNGNHEPNGQYAVVVVENGKVEIEIKIAKKLRCNKGWGIKAIYSTIINIWNYLPQDQAKDLKT